MKLKWMGAIAGLFLLAFASWGFMLKEEKPQTTASGINWVTMEEVESLIQKEQRKVLVDVYTDWCGWCKRMDKDTYENPKVVEYINKHYYAIKFNAEQKTPITLGDRTFKFVPNAGRRGIHELAVAMLGNRPGYPATVFFDQRLQFITKIPGYRKANEMMGFLSYFQDEVYKTNPNAQEYVNQYISGKK